MSPETCDRAMLELSVAHDEGRAVAAEFVPHVEGCDACSRFAFGLGELDRLLAAGDHSRAPDLVPGLVERASRPRRQWWSVAAVALVGLVVGALVGSLGTRTDVGLARDLGELFQTTSTELRGLSADVVVVERGVHPAVPERVYTGSIDYVAPEQLAIRLLDTTEYPDRTWRHNDVSLVVSDGDMVVEAGSPCPVAALPDCLVGSSLRAVTDQPPFDDGVLLPLEIVGPGRSLAWASAIEVVGTTELDDVPTVQVRSTVAAVELLAAIIGNGAWREIHPTDEVLMWLDEEHLVPVRIEVFAAQSPERELWQLRHGYDDDPENASPILIIEMSAVVTEPGVIEFEIPTDAPSRGFVDEEVSLPVPTLPDGFEPHRSGSWHLVDGGRVELASWSDGRSWVMVETTDSWAEPRLFGISQTFVEPIEIDPGSVGYLSPEGDAVAIHGADSDVLVSGSVSRETLVAAAASMGVRGLPVPEGWQEASTVDPADLPETTFTPEVEGWSVLGRVDGSTTMILLTGGGSRSVLLTQTPGSRLEPPTGPDYSEVEVRGVDGRYDVSETTLEWVEDGYLFRMRSETVGLAELVDLASTLEPR